MAVHWNLQAGVGFTDPHHPPQPHTVTVVAGGDGHKHKDKKKHKKEHKKEHKKHKKDKYKVRQLSYRLEGQY